MKFLNRLYSDFKVPDEDENRIRIFVSLAIFIGFPVLFSWGVVDYFVGKPIDSALDFIVGTFFLFNFYLFKRIKNQLIIFRLDILLLTILFLYYVTVGAENGSDLH